MWCWLKMIRLGTIWKAKTLIQWFLTVEGGKHWYQITPGQEVKISGRVTVNRNLTEVWVLTVPSNPQSPCHQITPMDFLKNFVPC